MTKKEMQEVVKNAKSKSEGYKLLYNEGVEIKEIANFYGVRYNFVYNVISNYCRVEDVELRTNHRTDGESKKDQVIAMLKAGKTCTEISKELKTNINYVYKLRKEVETA